MMCPCTNVVLALGLLATTANADPIETIVRERVTPAMPVGLGVAKVHLPRSLDKLDADPARVIVELPRDLRAGRASVKVTLRGRSTVYVPVSITRVTDVAIVQHAVAAGSLITAADITIEQRAVDAITPAAVGSVVGATATRQLATGMLVAARDVSLPPPLSKGTQITIDIRRGAVRVRGTGTLELAARPGDPATARLAHTKTIVRGTLHAPSTLVVGELP